VQAILFPRLLMSSTVASFTVGVRFPVAALQEKIQRENTPSAMSRSSIFNRQSSIPRQIGIYASLQPA